MPGDLYYIPPGPDVRELRSDERPTLGMTPPYSQKDVRTFETGLSFSKKNKSHRARDRSFSSSSSSSSTSSDSHQAHRKAIKKHNHRGRYSHKKSHTNRRRSCDSSCDRSLSISSMGSVASLGSSCFSHAHEYDQYMRDRHHLRAYIGSGEAETSALRRAIDNYWMLYGKKGCVDRRLPHSPRCTRTSPRRSGRGDWAESGSLHHKAECRCSSNCECKGGRARECSDRHHDPRHCGRSRKCHECHEHNGGESPCHSASCEAANTGRTSLKGSSHRRTLKRGPRKLYHRTDVENESQCYSPSSTASASGRDPRSDRDRHEDDRFARRCSDCASVNGQKHHNSSHTRTKCRGCRSDDCDCQKCGHTAHSDCNKRQQRCGHRGCHHCTKGCTNMSSCRHDDDYVIVIGKDITRHFGSDERRRLGEASGLSQPVCSHIGRAHMQRHRGGDHQRHRHHRPSSDAGKRYEAPQKISLPLVATRDGEVASPMEYGRQPSTYTKMEPPKMPHEFRPTASAAVGHVSQSPTNANQYYHYYSNLPANKMNSFRPTQVTEIKS